MQLASVNSDGEKKNDVKYIIPATQFEHATATLPKTEDYNTVVVEKKEEIDSTLHISKMESITSLNEDIPSYKAPNTSEKAVDKPVSVERETNHEKDLTNDHPTETNTSLEEKRKALLNKSKKNVSGLSLQGIEAKKSLLAKQQGRIIEKDKLPEDPFTQTQLNQVWSNYVVHLQDRGQQILASILNADQPKLQGTVIHLRFPNRSMKEDLEKSQGQILEYIQRELNNYLIRFKIDVDTTVTKKYVYTDQDKFSKLVEKNPAVDVLRRTFDLDF